MNAFQVTLVARVTGVCCLLLCIILTTALASCPNDCSGHGRCLSMKQLATMSTALPLSAATTYTGLEVPHFSGLSLPFV